MRHETFTTPGLVTTDDPRNLKGSTDFVLSTCGKQLPLEELASVVDANVLPMDLRSKNSVFNYSFVLLLPFYAIWLFWSPVALSTSVVISYADNATSDTHKWPQGDKHSLCDRHPISVRHTTILCVPYISNPTGPSMLSACVLSIEPARKASAPHCLKCSQQKKNTTPSGKCLCFFSLICLLCLEPSTPNQSSVTREAGT